MRILLLTGGLLILAVSPLTAQEASDSTRVFAVPASTPAAPGSQELWVGGSNVVSWKVSGPEAVGIAGAALVGLGLCLVLKSAGNGWTGAVRSA